MVGAVLVPNPRLLVHQMHLGTAPSWSELVFALPVAMVAYTGIETVSNMAEEAREPHRDVPKAVNLVLIAVLGRVHVAHLRRKLEEDPARPQIILTDAGVGYRLAPEP